MNRTIKNLIPKKVKKIVKDYLFKKQKAAVQKLPEIDEAEFRHILTDILCIKKGDVVFIHSSLDKINLSINVFKVLDIILDVVGEEGTVLFPTYPKGLSSEFLKEGKVFKISRTPSYTGILTEFARRHSKAIRSLHPTKSVAAIGKDAVELTKDHHKSKYPYSEYSPYYKLAKYNAKIIGLGVKSTYLSAIHVIDDMLKEDFPVNPYLSELFEAECIDYDKKKVIVKTLAHDMNTMDFDIPSFIKKYVDKKIARDVEYKGMKFFYADANKFFHRLKQLAEENITIYKKRHYKK